MTEQHPEEFSLYLDGRLSDQEALEMETRLAANAELRSRYEHFKSARDLVRASSRMQALPAGFDARLNERIRTIALRKQAQTKAVSELGRSSWWSKAALAVSGMAAGIAIMLGVNVLFGTPVDKGSPISPTAVLTSVDRESQVEQLKLVTTNKVHALRTLSQDAKTFGGAVNPNWLKMELQFSQLNTGNRALIQQAEALDLNELAAYLKSVEEAVASLNEASAAAARNGDAVDGQLVRDVLHSLKTPANLPKSQLRQEITNKEVRAYYDAREMIEVDPERARTKLRAFLRDYPNSHYRTLAANYLVHTCMRLWDLQGALDAGKYVPRDLPMESTGMIRPVDPTDRNDRE